MNDTNANEGVQIPVTLLQQTLATIDYLHATLRYLRQRLEEHYQDPYDEVPF